ncbi:hypothetical protein ACFQ3Z_45950 [Streptomyces nogalater]
MASPSSGRRRPRASGVARRRLAADVPAGDDHPVPRAYEDWGAHGTVTGVLDGENYTVDLLPPRSGTAVWGHTHVTRVWDAPHTAVTLPPVHPGGTLPIPGLRPTFPARRPLPSSVVGSSTRPRPWLPGARNAASTATRRAGNRSAKARTEPSSSTRPAPPCTRSRWRRPQPARAPYPPGTARPGIRPRSTHHAVACALPVRHRL